MSYPINASQNLADVLPKALDVIAAANRRPSSQRQNVNEIINATAMVTELFLDWREAMLLEAAKHGAAVDTWTNDKDICAGTLCDGFDLARDVEEYTGAADCTKEMS